ncbi:MAG: asparagine synthase (glutamine-hydrolyzing) [Sedimentisphaerales bacterium]|nr:asparagine synthase (glutamine-hydrolyzing) [Sedimentisphaerales bacterium]
MCGIAGIYHLNDRPVEPEALGRMTRLLRHRGPDDYGYAFFDRAGNHLTAGRELPAYLPQAVLALGHRRLSVIDLTETGHQPMSGAHSRYWIIYNGEIYNYVELRRDLIHLGYAFSGTSDTEVILKAYEHWGRNCVDHFNGMWAFALWDTKRQTLFCSRDRFGIKPFYYYFDGRNFIFASEIKSILSVLSRDKHVINEPYLGRFIMVGKMNDSEQTFFKNIRQLPPAHNLNVSQSGLSRRRYWDMPARCIKKANACLEDGPVVVERFRSLLTDAIRLRFRADVPVGTCLSGGLDSSSIVALASDTLSGQLSTFTAEYEQSEFSEGRYARQVAGLFGTDDYYITPTGREYVDFIDRFSWHHDEPCPGPGLFSQWHVMQLAGRHVKVVLEGQGADELLGGYPYYFPRHIYSLARDYLGNRYYNTSLNRFFNDLKAITAHPQSGLTLSGCALNVVHQIFDLMLPECIKIPKNLLIRSIQNRLKPDLINQVADQNILSQALPSPPHEKRRYLHDLNESLYWELTRDNLPMLLQYDDRTSMAFSVESRLPFLDYRLVEFAGSLPFYHKMQGARTKVILRNALAGMLPDEIVNRPDKKGFPTPFAVWLKQVLSEYVNDLFHSSDFKNRGLFHADKVQHLYRQHCSNTADHSWLLWRIINIERWMQVFQNDFHKYCHKYSLPDPPKTRPIKQDTLVPAAIGT